MKSTASNDMSLVPDVHSSEAAYQLLREGGHTFLSGLFKENWSCPQGNERRDIRDFHIFSHSHGCNLSGSEAALSIASRMLRSILQVTWDSHHGIPSFPATALSRLLNNSERMDVHV